MDETVVSGGAKRRHLSQRLVTCWPQLGYILYIGIYSILKFQITMIVR